MHRSGADDFAAERLPDRLVPEADPQDRNARCRPVDKVETYSGFSRRAGAGRKHNRIRPHRENIGDRNLVVAVDGNIGSQPAQIMEQVESEAVVVVDQDDHVSPLCQGFKGRPMGGQAAQTGGGLLSSFSGAGEATGFFGGPKQGFRLVDAFLLFEIGVAVRHDAGASLDVHFAVFHQGSA